MQTEPNLNKEVVNGLDISQIPDATLKGHSWRQEGTQLICQSCPFKHGTFIEPGLQLYGIADDGTPLIRTLKADTRDSTDIRA